MAYRNDIHAVKIPDYRNISRLVIHVIFRCDGRQGLSLPKGTPVTILTVPAGEVLLT